MAETTSTVDNPATTQDAATGGDALTTMVADQYDKHGQSSEGEPSSTTEPAAQVDKTGQPEGDESPPDITEGKITRLEQQIANQKKFFASLGIDPESDVIDRYNAGLITKEQLLQTVPPQEPKTEVTGIERLGSYRAKIKDKIGTGQELSQQDFLESLDIMGELAKDNERITQQANIRNLVSECERATQAVLEGDELHTVIPEDIQKIESQVFLGSTDNFLTAETHGDPHYLTPQSYGFYGQKNIEKYKKLRNAWIDYGKTLAKEEPPPEPPKPTINPISSGTGSAPMKAPETMINIDNMPEAARAYQRTHQPIV